MIKFCGNCGTTITEKEMREGRAIESGNYVYCGKCASRLGMSNDAGNDQAAPMLDIEDTTDTQMLNPDQINLDVPPNLQPRGVQQKAPAKTSSNNATKPVKTGGDKIEVACSSCQAKLRVPVSDKPRKIRCPKCSTVFQVDPPGRPSGTRAVKKVPGPNGTKAVKQESGPTNAVKPSSGPATKIKPDSGALEPIESDPDQTMLEPVKPAAEDEANKATTGKLETYDPEEADESSDQSAPKTGMTSRSSRRAGASGRRGAAGGSSRRSGRSAGASSRRRGTKGKVKAATGAGAGKGLWLLLLIVLIITGAPFTLMMTDRLDTELTDLSSRVNTGLGKIGLPAGAPAEEAPGTAAETSEENTEAETAPVEEKEAETDTTEAPQPAAGPAPAAEETVPE